MTNLQEIIGQLAGSASLCWEPRPTGVFSPSLANKYVAETQAAIAELVEKCLPKEIDYRGNGSEWNDCLKEIRNNLIKVGVLK